MARSTAGLLLEFSAELRRKLARSIREGLRLVILPN
jgi:hypothetical protein